jgi:hypothetical protein
MKTEIIINRAIKKWLNNKCNSERYNSYIKIQEALARNLKYFRKNRKEIYVPLRIICSAYLTQGSNNRFIKPPIKRSEFISAWEKVKREKNETKRQHKSKVFQWLKERGNHRFADKLSIAFSDYIEFNSPIDDFKELEVCKSQEEIKKFWKKFKYIGSEYAKNIPMDEKDANFLNTIKIDARLKLFLKDTDAEYLSNKQKEELYLKVAANLKMTGWEIDRLCFKFGNEIKELM